jgi:hypothetical protein
MDELRRYGQPGTVLKVMVYHRHSWKALEILLREGRGAFWRISELVQRHSEAQTDSPFTYTYTPRAVRELLKGFSVDSISIEHIFPYRIQDYVEYRYVKPWYFRYLPGFAFRWFEKRMGWHLCVTAHFASEADRRPGSRAWRFSKELYL